MQLYEPVPPDVRLLLAKSLRIGSNVNVLNGLAREERTEVGDVGQTSGSTQKYRTVFPHRCSVPLPA